LHPVTMVELDKLKTEIESIGEKIKALKAAETVDKDAIGVALKDLLEKKKLYADNNNGIGADGKPYEEPMTKAQKKAKAKAEKAAAAAGPAKPQAEPDSKGAQKKAAKKAAKLAAKVAYKSGESAPADAAGAAAAGGQPTTAKAAAAPVKKTLPPLRMTSRIQPNQIVINPNAPLGERPVACLAVAVLSNTILDYSIVSDHMSRHAALGLPSGGAVVGDFAMARYVCRAANSDLAGGAIEGQAVMDAWIDYAQTLTQLPQEQKINAIAMTLEHAIQNRTYLVGNSMSMADICLFAALGFPSQLEDKTAVLGALPEGAKTAKRWITMIASSSAVMEATQLAVGVSNKEAMFEDKPLEPLAEGMALLEGAIPGRTVTRFPPEPSGYLHIGHGKAVLLNDYYARRYRGRLIVRFDDTNPSKEKEEFQQSIIEDLGKLGVKPDLVTFTSDYFATIKGYAEYLIKNGLAYMDDTPQEQMKAERMERKNSKHHDQSVEDAMNYFKLMCSGSEEGSSWCLRAKINMQSVNGTLRDPVLYRQNLTPHHRSGTTHKAYPTYDLACPIVDSLEGVTHALRTTEYNDRDEQYQWILKALGLRRVRIHAFARVNFNYTVMSKRKLTWFVDNGYVTGWDDPRFPTVRGVVRRGINITALRNFMYSQGASRRVVNMEWSKFWAENKKEIDKRAKRFMAVDKANHVKMTITNAPENSANAFLTTDLHPKDPSLGKRVVRIGKEVMLETIDTEGMTVGEMFVLIRWGVMKVTKMDGGFEAEHVPDGDIKAAKRKISWLVNADCNTPCVLTEFDNLVTKEKLDEEDDFKDFINPSTLAKSDVIADASLKTLQQHDIIQLERRGYFRVDRPYMGPANPIVLHMVPDGKSKSMGGLTGKLAHR